MTHRTGPSDKKLLQDLYKRTSKVTNGGDDAVAARFGRMVAEYLLETMHQSFDGHGDTMRARRSAMKTVADMERCFEMTDRIEYWGG